MAEYQSYLPSVPQFQGQDSLLSGVNSAAQSYYPGVQQAVSGASQAMDERTQQEMANLQAVLQNSVPGTPQYEFAKNRLGSLGQQFGTLSSFTSPQGASQPASSAPASDGSFVNIGQQTPEELARNQRIMNQESSMSPTVQVPDGGNSAAEAEAAAARAASSGSSGGLNLGAASGLPSGSPQFNAAQPLNTGMVNYQSPGQPQAQNQQGVLQMQQANPQDALAQYKNTPGYQMLGNDQTAQYTQSPGYQYAVNEALKQVQQNASSRGLLESGSVMRDMTDRAQGMALQDYGNWWNRQNQLYGDYQNRLQGLAGGNTGAQDAMTLGTNLAQGSLQTGSNLGSLFGNQGTSGMGGIVNTGAAQANAMTQAGNQQAQILGANQATQLAGAVAQQKGLF